MKRLSYLFKGKIRNNNCKIKVGAVIIVKGIALKGWDLLAKKCKYYIILLINLICIFSVGCASNSTISLMEGKYQCTRNGEENTILYYEIDVEEKEEGYDFTLNMYERGMDLTISQAFSGSQISVTKSSITSEKKQIETISEIGTNSVYTHEFLFKDGKIYWKFVLNDEQSDVQKELAKKEYVILECVNGI